MPPKFKASPKYKALKFFQKLTKYKKPQPPVDAPAMRNTFEQNFQTQEKFARTNPKNDIYKNVWRIIHKF